MKKLIALILAATMALSLCACGGGGGGGSSKYTINLASGGTEEMSAKDFIKIHDTDERKFKENYAGCSFSGSGKITKIEEGPRNGFYYYTNEYSYYTVSINDNIAILTLADLLPECEVGDTVSFTSDYQTVHMGEIFLFTQNEETASIYIPD